eukprot:2636346-Rhodomonas_salina.2
MVVVVVVVGCGGCGCCCCSCGCWECGVVWKCLCGLTARQAVLASMTLCCPAYVRRPEPARLTALVRGAGGRVPVLRPRVCTLCARERHHRDAADPSALRQVLRPLPDPPACPVPTAAYPCDPPSAPGSLFVVWALCRSVLKSKLTAVVCRGSGQCFTIVISKFGRWINEHGDLLGPLLNYVVQGFSVAHHTAGVIPLSLAVAAR